MTDIWQVTNDTSDQKNKEKTSIFKFNYQVLSDLLVPLRGQWVQPAAVLPHPLPTVQQQVARDIPLPMFTLQDPWRGPCKKQDWRRRSEYRNNTTSTDILCVLLRHIAKLQTIDGSSMWPLP